MLYRLLADLVLLTHLFYVLFVLFGGFSVCLWKKAVFVHLASVAWAVVMEWAGWYCPLTPLENVLRKKGGEIGYKEGFVEHYLLPLIYPEELTRSDQIIMGLLVLAVNGMVYGWVWRSLRKSRTEREGH